MEFAQSLNARAVDSIEPGDELQAIKEPTVETLFALIGQVLTFAEVISKRSSKDPPITMNEGPVQPDDEIRMGHPEIEGASRIVAVRYPSVPAGRLPETGAKVLDRQRLPTRLPVDGVQMNDRNTKLAAEASGKGRFAGTGATHDDNPPHQGGDSCR